MRCDVNVNIKIIVIMSQLNNIEKVLGKSLVQRVCESFVVICERSIWLRTWSL